MSYDMTEMKVIRLAEKMGIIPNASGNVSIGIVQQILEEIQNPKHGGTYKSEDVKTLVGLVIVSMIHYCAIQKIDLTQCLKMAHEEMLVESKTY